MAFSLVKFVELIIWFIELINPLNFLDYVFKLVVRKSSAGKLVGHSGTVRCISVNKAGSKAISASGDHTLRVWNLESLECTATCGSVPKNLTEGGCGSGHGHVVTGVSLSPCGKRIASVSMDKTVRVWTVADGECLAVLRGHMQIAHCVAWSPAGSTLLTGASDRTLRFWMLRGPANSTWMDFSPRQAGGDELEFAFGHCSARETAEDRHEDTPVYEALTTRRRHNAPGFACRMHTEPAHESSVLACAYSPDGGRIASTSADGTVRLWSPAAPAKQGSEAGPGEWKLLAHCDADERPVVSCAWDVSGGAVAVGTEAGSVVVLDGRGLRPLQRLGEQRGYVTSVAVALDGAVLFCTGARDVMRLEPRWKAALDAGDKSAMVSSGKDDVKRLKAFRDGVASLALSANRAMLVAGLVDYSLDTLPL